MGLEEVERGRINWTAIGAVAAVLTVVLAVVALFMGGGDDNLVANVSSTSSLGGAKTTFVEEPNTQASVARAPAPVTVTEPPPVPSTEPPPVQTTEPPPLPAAIELVDVIGYAEDNQYSSILELSVRNTGGLPGTIDGVLVETDASGVRGHWERNPGIEGKAVYDIDIIDVAISSDPVYHQATWRALRPGEEATFLLTFGMPEGTNDDDQFRWSADVKVTLIIDGSPDTLNSGSATVKVPSQ